MHPSSCLGQEGAVPVLVGTGYFRNGNTCYSSSVSSVQVNERGTDFSVGFFLFFFSLYSLVISLIFLFSADRQQLTENWVLL